jgi:hypothetical protein
LKREQHIDIALHKQSEISRDAYFVRLNGAIEAARWLLKQGLPFRRIARWSLQSLVNLFPTIVKVLAIVEKEDRDGTHREQT